MPFTHHRTIRFQDTDAAGVVYFANVLAICHEAYEAALSDAGIDLRHFFTNPDFAMPIVHARVDFRRPLFCGQTYAIQVQPTRLTPGKFEILYRLGETVETLPPEILAEATTVHVCIDSVRRCRRDLPGEMIRWLENLSKPSGE